MDDQNKVFFKVDTHLNRACCWGVVNGSQKLSGHFDWLRGWRERVTAKYGCPCM